MGSAASMAARNEALDAWLKLEAEEDVLEPELRICDPHHHLWDHSGDKSQFIVAFVAGGEVTRYPYAYLLPELLRDVGGGHNVASTVYVQAGSYYRAFGPREEAPIGEVEFAQGMAAVADSGCYGPTRACAAIVGAVNLADRSAEAVLRTMMKQRNFRGVRVATPELSEDFLAGVALLEKYDLVYEFWDEDFATLPTLVELAGRFPTVVFVLDHCGGKLGPSTDLRDWGALLGVVAEKCPNVVCKVGGLLGPKNGFELHAREAPVGSEELCDLLFPFYAVAIRAFGPSRCMFESNFPVDRMAASYLVLWNAHKRVCARLELGPEEKREIFHDVAARTYRLAKDDVS